ncbi:uncharacterized protein BXZ73DRAFT_103746 [Epithele typhae]|uniref:uncharacterized protein n=1 Tax=Epithele typhae TaxID=378194 RepID=UPI0020071FB7|nr:uncharacterized protein BXZ73DRAFT_103746 [Epithele typhae]KAH9923700.1 hypothetical protein BXZ73DRAFT_103746 [Epithele typhae]
MQLVQSPSPIPMPHRLSSRTNAPSTRSLKVHFKLPVIKKASPTVSITNANAAARLGVLSVCADVPQPAAISFPSAPVPIPASSRKRALSDFGHGAPNVVGARAGYGDDGENTTKANALPFHRRISHIDIIRRRSNSCVPGSIFPTDAQLPQEQLHAVAFPSTPSSTPTSSSKSSTPSLPPFAGSRKRPAGRRESMSAGTPPPPSRKARRVVADAAFLAAMHSSIALHIRARLSRLAESISAAAGSDDDVLSAQDAVLVDRIWHNLVDMGYRPPPPPSPTAPASTEESAHHAIEQSQATTTAADRARAAAERAARRTLEAQASRPAQDLPLQPAVLPVPQLVATLIMRHRDRAAVRPRSSSSSRKRAVEEDLLTPPSPRRRRSPLSTTFLPSNSPFDG